MRVDSRESSGVAGSWSTNGCEETTAVASACWSRVPASGAPCSQSRPTGRVSSNSTSGAGSSWPRFAAGGTFCAEACACTGV
jgi:hypothetical protein